MGYLAGAYARFNVTTGDAQVYLVAGRVHTKFRGESDVDGKFSEDNVDVSYGIGVDFYGNEHWAVTAEILHLADNDDYKLRNAGLGLTYRY